MAQDLVIVAKYMTMLVNYSGEKVNFACRYNI